MKRRRDAAYLLAAASLGCLLIATSVHPYIAPVCLVWLVIQRALLDRGGVRIPEPALALLHIWMALVFIYLTLLGEREADGGADMLELLLGFGAPFLLLKLAAPPSRFNDAVTVLTCVVLALGSAATAPGVRPVIVIVLFLTTACLVLPVLIRRDPDPEDGVVLQSVGNPPGWRLAPLVVGIALTVVGLLFGTLHYIFVPRIGPETSDALEQRPLEMGARERLARERKSGFAREMKLGDIGEIKRDDRVAFEARLRYYGRPHDPPAYRGTLLLLRARAWETYIPAERKWVRRLGKLRWLPPSGELTPNARSTDWPIDWQMTVHGYDGRTLFLPQSAGRIRSGGVRIAQDRTGSVIADKELRTYGVEAGDPITSTVSMRRLEPGVASTDLLGVPPELLPDLRRYLPATRGRRLADKIEAVDRFFMRNNFRYTLHLPPSLPQGVDPIIAFLDRKEGHCELFASAACFFLRMHGVPARVAGGVRLSQRLGRGHYQARFRNAHAWVEVATRTHGFVAFDFTPADSAALPPTRRVGGGSPDAADAATLGIDQRQAQAGAAAAAEDRPLLDWKRPFDFTRDDQARLRGYVTGTLTGGFAGIVAVLFGLLMLFTLVRSGWRRRRANPLRVHAPSGVAARTLAFYATWLKECASRGHRRARQQTPREFLATLPTDLREAGVEITGKFEQLRYGGKALNSS